jgi:DNA-binding MarR family transcriptional regulator
MTMELRVLRYFLTVAQEESFSRAAEKLHLSQPTLSRQLKDLEDEFGKQLLIREPRRILLTEDGLLLRRRAEEILSLVDKTTGELLRNEEISGDIRVGAGESIHFGQIMAVAQRLRQKHPGLRFAVGECMNGDPFELSLALVRRGFAVPEIYGTITGENFIFLERLAEISPETRVFSNLEPTMLYYDCSAAAIDVTIGKDAGYYHPGCPNLPWNQDVQPFGYAGVTALYGALEGLLAEEGEA